MSEKKIVDLTKYRKSKEQINKDFNPSNKKKRSFEEKLQDFIHRPFNEPGSTAELVNIFEEKQIKKEEDNKKK